MPVHKYRCSERQRGKVRNGRVWRRNQRKPLETNRNPPRASGENLRFPRSCAACCRVKVAIAVVVVMADDDGCEDKRCRVSVVAVVLLYR